MKKINRNGNNPIDESHKKPKSIKIRVIILRELLNRNKIFFDIFFIGTLSFMAIFLSIKTNSIYTYQARIAEQQTMPQINIIQNQIFNEVEQKYTDEILLINNEGEALTNFNSQNAVFYKINYKDGDEYKEKVIPINGYYFYLSLTGRAKGLLAENGGYHNNQKYIDLQRQLRDYVKNNGKEIGVIDLQRYLEVSYKDILGKFHVEYYILGVGKATQLEEMEGQKIFKRYNDSYKNGEILDIDKLNIQTLTKLLWK